MEAYAPELTSPPLPLVALVGQAELLPPIAEYLRAQHAPRLAALGIPDAHSVAGTLGAKKAAPSAASPPAGILKSNWLKKHRSARPAVLMLLVDRSAVTGDPSAWAWLVSQLDALKAAARPRGTRLVVAIVQPPGAADLPEDRCAMICRQAGCERRCVLTYTPSEGLPALQVLGRVLHEQAVLFYAADAQRRLTAHGSRNAPSVDLNLRTAFKLGALAEFRADWAAALRMYREAYGYLPQILAAVGTSPQRFAEVRAVAEQVHVKIVSLLLLALKQLPDAVAQFEAHVRLLRRLPFEAPPGLLASHHAWLCRQHMVLAELLVSCGDSLEGLKREQQPGALYLAAARAAIERRRVAAFISGMHGGQQPPSPGKVEPGLYVGQAVLLAADPARAALVAAGTAVVSSLAGLPVTSAMAAAGATRRMTDEQFELHLEAEEAKVPHSQATVDLLRTAQDALARSGRRTGKTLQHARLLLGHELLDAGDTRGAERLLTDVAGFYRRERWEGPLASALQLLRECRQQEHDLQAHTELSLELSALEGAALDAEQRAAMATAAAAVLTLKAEAAPLAGLAEEPAPAGREAGSTAQQQQQQQQQQAGMHFSVAGPESPWLSVLPLCAGFFDPLRPQAAAAGAASGGSEPGSPARRGAVRFAVAVWNNSPIDLPLSGAEVLLEDALGSFAATLLPQPSSRTTSGRLGEAPGPAAVLRSGAWLRLTAAVPVRCSGELDAAAVVLRFGGSSGAASSSLAYRLSGLLPKPQRAPTSPRAGQSAVPAQQTAVGWLRGGWSSSQPPFSLSGGFLPGRCSTMVPPRHTPPLLAVQAPEALLQGEQAAVTVCVGAGLDAIQNAVLTARAVHLDSQQALGLVPAAGSAPGAVPLPDGGCRLLLGDLAAGQQAAAVLLVDARYAGAVEVAAELEYAAESHDLGTPGGTTKREEGRCTAALAAHVRVPWRLGIQLLGPPATHTLLAASSGSGANTEALLAEQARRLHALAVQDGAAAAAAPDLGPASDSRDLALQLLRGLPPRFVLPAGQRCTALVQLQSQAACPLDVLAVELQPAEGLTAVPAAGAAAALPAGGGEAETLGKSDAFTAVFTLASRSGAAAELPSLGFLRLCWRRHERRPPLLSVAARGGSQLSPSEASAALAALEGLAVEQGGSSAPGSAPAAPMAAAAPPCEVLVPLPAVSLLQPLLSAEVQRPASATAGMPVQLVLLMQNSGATSQEVAVAVGDPHGFLLAGPKTMTVQLLPHASSQIRWQATAYHTGLLRLPDITVSSLQYGQEVEVTRGCTMFVERPPEEVDATC